MEKISRDIRYAVRVLWNNPWFTIVSVLVLALGLGANTAIFSVVYSILLKPLPYRDPGRLVVALHEGRFPVSPADFLDYKAQVQAFDQMAAAQAWGGYLAGADRTENISGLQVTANLIAMLGVEPLLGRTFTAEEDQSGASRVLLISHRLWQREFGGDTGVVGRSILLSDQDFTIVGVMPPQFQFAPFWQTQAEMWTPLVLGNRIADRQGRSLRIFARLRPNVSIAEAQAQMDTVARRLAAAYPRSNTNLGIQVVPLHEKVVGAVRPTLLLLIGTVALVLIIACTDITNLVLTRAVARRKEVAVRLAIGANRFQIVRQFVIESLVLAGLGGSGGLLFARLSLAALNAILPKASLPRQNEVAIDTTVFAFSLLVSLVAGLASGLVPALQASRLDLTENLKQGGRTAAEGSRSRRTQAALVVTEVCLALVLLVCSGLMIRSLRNLNTVDAGFNPQKLLTFQVGAPRAEYDTPEKRVALFKRVEDDLVSLPGVQSAGATNHLPIGGDIWTFGYEVTGRPPPPPGRGHGAVYRVIRPGYFQTMQLPLLRGHGFSERDDESSPAVVVINDAMARRQWPGEDPIGKQISFRDQAAIPMTIIGVVKNARQSEWTGEPNDEVYLPYLQRPGAFGLSSLTFVVRTVVDAEALIEPVRKSVRAINRNIPLSDVRPMRQVIADKLWRSNLSALLLGVFGGIALILAAVGIYGVVSYGIRQRTQEIGIRMALGATKLDVLKLVITENMQPVILGVVFGAAVSVAAARLITTLLYEVTATDPLTFLSVIVVLICAAALAICIPTLRAITLDPVTALRQE